MSHLITPKPTLEEFAIKLTLLAEFEGLRLVQLCRNLNPEAGKRQAWIATVGGAATQFNGLGASPFGAVEAALIYEKLSHAGSG